jgi:hypothetical protein
MTLMGQFYSVVGGPLHGQTITAEDLSVHEDYYQTYIAETGEWIWVHATLRRNRPAIELARLSIKP